MLAATLSFVNVLAVSESESTTDRGLAIFTEADARNAGYRDLQVDLQMVLRNRRGDETWRGLRIQQLEVPEDGDKLLVVFETPKTIKGTALLSFAHKSQPDDQWLFLPAVSRVKKIASRNRSGPFLGSEFAFEDLIAPELEKFTYAYLREETIDAKAHNVVERRPIDELSGYTRQVVWIDRDEYRITKIDFYDRRDTLLKTLKVADYREYLDKFWKPHLMAMENHQTGKSTELLWSNYAFDTGLSAERDFTTNSLRRVR